MPRAIETTGAPRRDRSLQPGRRRPGGRARVHGRQVGNDPGTGKLVPGGIEAETERALDNLAAVLAAAGLTFADVVKTTVFLLDLADFPAMNAVYARRLGASCPARSTVGVSALPLGARVEIDMVAAGRSA